MKRSASIFAVILTYGVIVYSLSWSHPIVTLGGLALFAVAMYNIGARQDKQNQDALQPIRDKLKQELLDVSLLVSKKCPDNKQAHLLVIEAAQCLVYPDPGRRIVYFHDIKNRYEEGLQKLQEARKIAGA